MAKVFIDKSVPNFYRKPRKPYPLLGNNRTAVQSEFVAETPIPHWGEICKTLQKVDIWLGIEYEMLGGKCNKWSDRAKKELECLPIIENVSIKYNGFHYWLEIKFKERNWIYLFDRTIAQLSSVELFYKKDIYDPTLKKFTQTYGYYGLKSAAPKFYKKNPAVY
jgi:hypothetical protein